MKPKTSSSGRSNVIKSLPELQDYDPQHFLCCHSILEGQKRHVTKVWMCAFEPSLHKQGETGTILATCGGNTVCFIDVMTGLVMKRFKDTEKSENFYCLAWTSLEGDGKKVNVLAVAGNTGTVKLIYPDQLVCYSTIKGHRRYVSCLTFHSKYPNLLFSGSADGFIMLWNIGAPDAEGSVNHIPLLKLKTSEMIGDALSMVFNDKMGTLLAVTEKGCVGWSLGKISMLASSSNRTRVIDKHNFSFLHPKSGSSVDAVDSVVALDNGLVATKCVGSGEILIWSLEDHVRSHGSKKQIQVQPLLHLEFPETSVEYISMGYVNGVLSVGDDEGNIHLYDVEEAVKSLPVSCPSPLAPSRVLEWPSVNGLSDDEAQEQVVMNVVAMTSDHTVVAGGTDNNLVCVWHQSQH